MTASDFGNYLPTAVCCATVASMCDECCPICTHLHIVVGTLERPQTLSFATDPCVEARNLSSAIKELYGCRTLFALGGRSFMVSYCFAFVDRFSFNPMLAQGLRRVVFYVRGLKKDEIAHCFIRDAPHTIF